MSSADSERKAKREVVLAAIYRAIGCTNESIRLDTSLVCAESVVICGDTARLDSLGLAIFLVAVEGEVNTIGAGGVCLTEDLASVLSEVSTIGDLADFLTTRI
jgi:hypothetical protein